MQRKQDMQHKRTAQSKASRGRAKQAPAAAFPHTHLHRYALPTRVLYPEGVPHAQFGRRAGPGAGNRGAEAQSAEETPGTEHGVASRGGRRPGSQSAGVALFTRTVLPSGACVALSSEFRAAPSGPLLNDLLPKAWGVERSRCTGHTPADNAGTT
ncbi:hypothetical protein I79_020911 [Cricetulus griseus]|uniref:Uncharacterized protein n=1 Tax=Cricetulus griseus TaxID=10029 RepID=G3IB93_CRIGR|nr:hypothetical protein I79_020911 [Cricetulus griseus]